MLPGEVAAVLTLVAHAISTGHWMIQSPAFEGVPGYPGACVDQ